MFGSLGGSRTQKGSNRAEVKELRAQGLRAQYYRVPTLSSKAATS